MSATTVIVALIFYPLLYSLPLNLVRFQWGFRQGLAPMPPEVEERAEAADRAVLLASGALLLVVIVFLMHGVSFPAYAFGLTVNDWKSAVALGILAALALQGVAAIFPSGELEKEPESRGPLSTWCGFCALRSFSDELWRAFCIVVLIRLGLSAWVAVLISTVAYGSSQLWLSTARAAGTSVFGAVAGFLFVTTGSLLAPLAMSLIAGGFHLYRVRNARSRAAVDLPPLKCPLCSQTIDRGQNPPGKLLLCPGCGVKLRVSLDLDWQLNLCGAACSLLTLFALGLDLVWSLVLFVPLFFLFLVLSSLVAGRFLPGRISVEVYRNPHDPNDLRLFRL